MKTSEQINEVATALAAAQGEFPQIPKLKQATVKGVSKTSGKEFSISYAYADIADVLSAVIPVLSKHKLALIQPTVVDGGAMTILTRIIHASGQWIESEYPVCSLQGDHQKMGGALTYGRRYALCTMLGVAADEDVDGQEAAEPAPRHLQPVIVSSGRPPAEKEPAVSSNAIAMGREIKSITAIKDIDSFKKTPEFVDWWKAANNVDRQHVVAVAEQRKAQLDVPIIAAG